jgi:hypothetical protein
VHHHPGAAHPAALKKPRNLRPRAFAPRGAAALMCVPKHTLSADFTTRIAALLHVEHPRACHVRAPDARLVQRENSEKKGTFATPECKKDLAKV